MNNGYEVHQTSTANSLMLLCLGAAVGATVMLLCAPASGSEVRARIAGKASEIKDKAGEWTEQVAEKAGEWKQKTMAAAGDTLERAADNLRKSDGAGTVTHTAQPVKA